MLVALPCNLKHITNNCKNVRIDGDLIIIMKYKMPFQQSCNLTSIYNFPFVVVKVL